MNSTAAMVTGMRPEQDEINKYDQLTFRQEALTGLSESITTKGEDNKERSSQVGGALEEREGGVWGFWWELGVHRIKIHYLHV